MMLNHRLKGIELYHCDFRKLNIPDNAASLIVADPMWDEIDQFQDLAAFAKRVLKPGGKLLLFSGNFDLPEKLAAIAQNLTFVLPLGVVFSYPRPRLAERLLMPVPLHQAMTYPAKRYMGKAGLQFFEAYQSLTLWVKGTWNVNQMKPFYNIFIEEGYEKEFHECQQSLKAIRYYVGLMTEPGDLVIETHGGGFTVAQAVRLLNQEKPGRNLRCISCDIMAGCVETGCKRLLETDR